MKKMFLLGFVFLVDIQAAKKNQCPIKSPIECKFNTALGYLKKSKEKLVKKHAHEMIEYITDAFEEIDECVKMVLDDIIKRSPRLSQKEIKDLEEKQKIAIDEAITKIKKIVSAIKTAPLENILKNKNNNLEEALAELDSVIRMEFLKIADQTELKHAKSKKKN